MSFIDVDECAEQPTLCKPYGTCVNKQGSFTCQCQNGYFLNKNGTGCTDVDECVDEDMCQYGCVNMIGAYRCDCPFGFVQYGFWGQCVGMYMASTD